MLYVFDIDGTICVPGRDYERPHTGKSFDHAKLVMDPCRVAQDRPIPEACQMVRDLQAAPFDAHVRVAFLTGRAEWSRDITEAWLDEHGMLSGFLFMRPSEDQRESWVVKTGILERLDPNDSITVFDDDWSVIDWARAHDMQAFHASWLVERDPE